MSKKEKKVKKHGCLRFIGFVILIGIILIVISVVKNNSSDKKEVSYNRNIITESKTETTNSAEIEKTITQTETVEVDTKITTVLETEVLNTETTEISTDENITTENIDEVSDDKIRPEIKEMIDSYEAFIDKYIAFMKDYETSSDLTLLMEYTELMNEYAKFAKEIEDIGESELSDAEALYYVEVTSRVNLKLAEASLQ